MLTFKGVKSGKARKTALMRIEHDGTYAVVASNDGAAGDTGRWVTEELTKQSLPVRALVHKEDQRAAGYVTVEPRVIVETLSISITFREALDGISAA